MRLRALRLLALLALPAAGCVPVASLYPLVPGGESIAVPEIVGEWGDSTGTIRFYLSDPESGTRYGLAWPDSTDCVDSTTTFTVRFARFGGRLFADIVVDADDAVSDLARPFLWPTHMIFRIDLAGDSLRMAFLDEDWLNAALKNHEVKVRRETPEDGLLITEPTSKLQSLVKKVANEDAAFDPNATYAHRR